MTRRLPLLLLLLPVLGAAQNVDPIAAAGAGINWMAKLTQHVDELTTSTSGTLIGVGQIELAFLAAGGFIFMAIRWQLQLMNMFHHMPKVHAGEIYWFFMKVGAAEAMLTSYDYIHRLFPTIFQQLSNLVDMHIVKAFLDQMQVFTVNLQMPGVLNIPGSLVVVGVMVLIGVVYLAMFALNSISFIAVGIFTFTGPLMIPLFVTKRFENRFWGWVDNMAVYSSYRLFASIVTFVFANLFMDFFTEALNGDYSIGMMIATFTVLIMLSVGFVWIMFRMPSIASAHFGGAGGLGQQFSSDVQGFITSRVGK